MGALGLICLLLAALGLYSVMSYAVSQRWEETGIRMAMGAPPGDVVGMVVRQGMKLSEVRLACRSRGLVRSYAPGVQHAGEGDAADPLISSPVRRMR